MKLFTSLLFAFTCFSISAQTVCDSVYKNTVIICLGDSALLQGAFQASSGTYMDTISIGSNCDSIVQTELVVSMENMQFDITSPTFPVHCEGDTLFLTGATYYVPDTCRNIDYPNAPLDDVQGFPHAFVITVDCYDSLDVIGDEIWVDALNLNIEHSFMQDLSIELICPDGFPVTIVETQDIAPSTVFLGEAVDDYVDPYLPGLGYSYSFSDDASFMEWNIEKYAAPFVSFVDQGGYMQSGLQLAQGNYLPDNSLDGFTGCHVNGDWTLLIYDNYADDNGTLFSWGIDFLGEVVYGPDSSAITSFGWDMDSIFSTDSVFMVVNPPDSFFTYTVTNTLGCTADTTIELQLALSDTTIDTMELCLGDSLLIGGEYRDTSGVFYETYSGSTGCDSIIEISVTLLLPYHEDTVLTYCNIDTLWIDGLAIVSDTLISSDHQSVNGCDSIINTQYLFGNSYASNTTFELCNEDSMLWNGLVVYTDTVLVDSLVSLTGCDSIISAEISFGSSSITLIDHVLCAGEISVILTDTFYTDTTFIELFGTTGCDSIVEHNITFLNATEVIAFEALCEGELWNGTAYYNDTILVDSLTTSAGCDSVVTTTISVYPDFLSSTIHEACDGDSILFENLYFHEDTTITELLQSVNGCDSVITNEFIFHPLPDVSLDQFDPDSICSNLAPFPLPAGFPIEGIYDGPGVSNGMFDPSLCNPGSVNISYTVVDANGCSATVYSTIFLDLCNAVEFNENSIEAFNIYPNPTSGLFYLELNTNSTTTIEIYNMLGERVLNTTNSDSGVLTLDLNKEASGVYMVVLKSGTQLIQKRLIKK